MNVYPPLSGGITAISSALCKEIMASSDSSMYSWFNANSILFCIGCNLHTHHRHILLIIILILIIITNSSSSSSSSSDCGIHNLVTLATHVKTKASIVWQKHNVKVHLKHNAINMWPTRIKDEEISIILTVTTIQIWHQS